MYSRQKIKMGNNLLDQSISQAKIILNEYDICDNCTGRLFTKKMGLSSNQLLGKKIKNRLNFKSSKICYICKEIHSHIQSIVDRMLAQSSDYEFSTFVLGAILKPSIIDRDDLIRSKFKLQGIDSVKTSITKELSKKFATKTKKKIDFLNPELTFTYNFKNDSCELQTRTLILSGRYVKKNRGLPQKQSSCINCNGKGCLQCNNHGFSNFTSVEGKIAEFLFEKFSGIQTKTTWIGGEDKNSLVLGNGRPFFIKLFNPKKRVARLLKKYSLDEIEIHNLKIISKSPKKAISFRSTIKLSILTEHKLTQKSLEPLKTLKKTSIEIFEKPNKRTQKSIYRIKFKKSSSKSFLIWFTADGGLPIKRFVEGNNVHPNLSELLGNKCMCKEFDFHKVDLLNI
jgi:tRNA pseudouridine synthase 10